MLIAQLTDLHINTAQDSTQSLVDEAANLALALRTIRKHKPDVLLLTGDLVNNAATEEYELLLSILSETDITYFPIAGNHDDSRLMRTAFGERIPRDAASDHLSYVVDDYPVRLVALDTSDVVLDEGVFPPDRAAWLDHALSQRPDTPTLLFTHYPPFTTGIVFMDLAGLRERDEFAAVLARHPQVHLVVTGHLHRTIATMVGSTRISVCPSTVHQLRLDFDPNRGAVLEEPPGFQLHFWTGSTFVTHTGVLGDFPAVDLGNYVDYVQKTAAAGDRFYKSTNRS